MPLYQKLLLIALAGAAGTLARFGVAGVVQRLHSTEFPWGTFAANAAGCFLFGIVWSLAEERLIISGTTRAIVLIGFMGAFTTFSTFAFETGQMLDDAQWLPAAGNLLLHNVTGIALVLVGIALGRLF
ncbi:MAG: CrcB family protein [Planctomycetota bacterium]|mgnify:CR=1 FL=1|nr:MAG: CrcB family protein [Planctomycetota bacterium]